MDEDIKLTCPECDESEVIDVSRIRRSGRVECENCGARFRATYRESDETYWQLTLIDEDT